MPPQKPPFIQRLQLDRDQSVPPTIGIARLHLGRMLLLYFFDPIPTNLT
jgi:hypothetical protein